MTRQSRSKSSQTATNWQGDRTPQEHEHMIREAAYYRYLEHGCCDGHDVDDWLEAEAEIDRVAEPTATPDKAPGRSVKRPPRKPKSLI